MEGKGSVFEIMEKQNLFFTSERQNFQFLSVQFSCSVVFDSLRPHGLQNTRFPCPSPTPRAYSNSLSIKLVMPSNHLILCHPLLLLPSFFPSIRVFSNESVLCPPDAKNWLIGKDPASGSFPMSQFFASCGQSIRVSASISVLAMNIQDWFLFYK